MIFFVSPAAQSTIIDRSADIHTTDRRSWTSQHLLWHQQCREEPSHRCEWKWSEERGIYVSKSAVVMLQVEMIIFVGVILWMCVFSQEPSSKVMADRYAVYWNRTNPRWADLCLYSPPLRWNFVFRVAFTLHCVYMLVWLKIIEINIKIASRCVQKAIK